MTRSVLPLLLCPLVAFAAPVPKANEKEQIEKKFGTIEDPEKDCTFGLDGDKLKITMKGGKQYEWDMDGKVKNCPRIVREVKGDFVATVKAYAELPEKAEQVGGKWGAEAGAGLIVIQEKDWPLRIGLHDFRTAKDRYVMAVLPGCYGPSGTDVKAPGEGIYVRLIRKGNKYDTGVSVDGKKWVKPLWDAGNLVADSYQVGVYAFSNSKSDVTVTLSEFSVEALKEEKKEDKK